MIEMAGSTCYKSENRVSSDSAEEFVRNLILNQHEAMLEHSSLSVRFICDRGVSHELVRHRLASFAQESTRYCNYSDDRFGNELTFIRPCYLAVGSVPYAVWEIDMRFAEATYFNLLDIGCTPQEARAVLPNSVKTEVVMTANYREWRHFFDLRAAGVTGRPHPQMLELTVPLLNKLHNLIPVVFDDIWELVEMNTVKERKIQC